MIIRNIKLLIGVCVLLAYMGIGIFGLFEFSHANEMPMENCPYAQNGYSLCENSFDHINNWRQFSNTTFSALFILSLLILGIILYFYNKRNFLKQNQYFYRWKYRLYDKKLNNYDNKIIKWLSLFENSPSFSYVRHS